MRKSFLAVTLAIGCTEKNATKDEGSCLQTIVSDDVDTNSQALKQSFYWGLVEVKYDPDLAPVIFQKHTGKKKLLKDPSQTFTCRIFYIPNGKYLDGWTSRHCVMQAAVREIKYFIFNDSYEKILLEHSDPFRSDWKQIGDAVKGIGTLEDWGARTFLDSFAPKFLHFNSYTSHLYSVVDQNLLDSEAKADKKSDTPLYQPSPYYQSLLQAANPEQNAFDRDICATDYTLSERTPNLQQVCFSTTDMSIVQIEKPPSMQLADFNGQGYTQWRDAHLSLDKDISAFLVTEAAYQIAIQCKTFSREGLEKCSAYPQLTQILKAADSFSSAGVSRVKIYDLVKSVFDNPSTSPPSHLSKLQASFSHVGKTFADQSKSFEGDKFDLAGFFLKQESKKNTLGMINLKSAFSKSTASMSLHPSGFALLTNSTRVVFEEQDSGSIIFINGMPIAALSTVNGESSSGGLASTPPITVDTPEDLLPKPNSTETQNKEVLAQIDKEVGASSRTSDTEQAKIAQPTTSQATTERLSSESVSERTLASENGEILSESLKNAELEDVDRAGISNSLPQERQIRYSRVGDDGC